MDSRLLFAFRALGADVDRLPEIPEELAAWISSRTPEDLERIRRVRRVALGCDEASFHVVDEPGVESL